MARARRGLWRWLALLGASALLCGCGPSMQRGFDSPEPGVRNDAIVSAAARNDRSAVRDLIRMLDSDDPATRMLAINALERITGQTNGYDYAAPEGERLGAIRRWQEWEAKEGVTTASGSPSGAAGNGPGTPAQQP